MHSSPEIIDISRPLQAGTACWPGDVPYSFQLGWKIVGGASVNVGSIQSSVHTATHCDSPFHYDDHGQLKKHLADFIDAYNFGRRLKTLKGLTPYEFICKQWTLEPDRFIIDPIHQMPGLNT